MDLLDVIEWQDVSGQEIVHRWPPYGPGTVRLGAQLTVRESQAAVFFRDGKALDVLGVGRHTLATANIPLLEQLVKIPFGGQTLENSVAPRSGCLLFMCTVIQPKIPTCPAERPTFLVCMNSIRPLAATKN